MRLWYIRSVDRRFYLPPSLNGGRNGNSTFVNPVRYGSDGLAPRLFYKESSAKASLTHWLNGPVLVNDYGVVGHEPDENRRVDEWEIAQLDLADLIEDHFV